MASEDLCMEDSKVAGVWILISSGDTAPAYKHLFVSWAKQ